MFSMVFFAVLAFIGAVATSVGILVAARIIANAIRPSARPLG